jgi:hypothetical protein
VSNAFYDWEQLDGPAFIVNLLDASSEIATHTDRQGGTWAHQPVDDAAVVTLQIETDNDRNVNCNT